MKKSFTVALEDEELIDLQRIIQDCDAARALLFLDRCLRGKVKGALEGAGHCKPYFEVQAMNAMQEEM